jgi:hypothetical protein
VVLHWYGCKIVGAAEGCASEHAIVGGPGLGGARESARNTEGIFPFLVNFWTIFRFSVIFGTEFSLFCRFFNSGTRYTRKLKPTLYYWSSPTRVEAPQLGPRGYRI